MSSPSNDSQSFFVIWLNFRSPQMKYTHSICHIVNLMKAFDIENHVKRLGVQVFLSQRKINLNFMSERQYDKVN